MSIGEKIKKLRNNLGMTQSELCGDYITRNMLSQIENGIAKPSIDTVTYIADKLGVPAGFLLTDTDDLLAFQKLTCIDTLRDLYTQNKFSECAEICERLPGCDDEIALILSNCYLNIGKEHLQNGNIRAAENALNASLAFSDKTVYSSDDIKRKALVYLSMIDSFRKKSTATDVLGAYESVSDTDNDYGYLMYLNILKLIDEQKSEYAAKIFDSVRIKNVLYRMHINARLSSCALNFERARELLLGALNGENGQPDPILKYRLLCDLEQACKALSDYETAYNASVQKSELYSELTR